VTVPANLTSEAIDELLEQSRLEMERDLVKAGPKAVSTLVDVMETAEKDSDRLSAAKEVIAQVRGRAGTQQPEAVQQGPTIHVTINQLSTGERRALPIPVSEAVMDAIEAGVRALDD
jgi:hypothetical protein